MCHTDGLIDPSLESRTARSSYLGSGFVISVEPSWKTFAADSQPLGSRTVRASVPVLMASKAPCSPSRPAVLLIS